MATDNLRGDFAANITGDMPGRFWNDLLYERSMALIAGPSGVGKSLIVRKIVADLSAMGHAVIYGNREDDLVVQRFGLEASGANLDKVRLASFTLPSDLDLLEYTILSLKAKLVVFDTAQKHLEGPMQRWDIPLAQLTEVLARTDCSALYVHHTNKNAKKSDSWHAVIGGSTAGLAGTARLACLVGQRPNDDGQVVLCPAKDSYRARPDAFVYEFNTEDITQANGDLVEISHMSLSEKGVKIANPTDLVVVKGDSNGTKGPDPVKAAEAADFLKAALKDGPMPVNDVYLCKDNPASDKSDPTDPDWKSRSCGHMSVKHVEQDGGGSCPGCGGKVTQVEGLKSRAEAAQVSFGTIKRAKAALTIDTECKGFAHKRVQHWSLPAGHPNLESHALDYLP